MFIQRDNMNIVVALFRLVSHKCRRLGIQILQQQIKACDKELVCCE
jgi:hypothetical protein